MGHCWLIDSKMNSIEKPFAAMTLITSFFRDNDVACQAMVRQPQSFPKGSRGCE
jgi:hypothetical protein